MTDPEENSKGIKSATRVRYVSAAEFSIYGRSAQYRHKRSGPRQLVGT